MADATFRGSGEQLTALFGKLNAALAGDPNGYERFIQPILEAIGISLLSSIQQAFLVKSAGGIASDGIKWDELKPETIARRRIGEGDLLAIGVKGSKIPQSRTRGLLTQDQDYRWRKIFAQVYMRSVFELGDTAAKAKAGSIAWSVLKAEGAQTKLMVLGSRSVMIGRDTGMLFRSLSPTTAEFQPEGQIFELAPGEVTVGTNQKPWFHEKRPLWPKDNSIPESWMRSIIETAESAIGKAYFAVMSTA